MDFQKYLTNLDSQLKAVNSDIAEKQEELDKLHDFRARIKGGIEVVKQIQSDNPPPPVAPKAPTREEIMQTVEELAQSWHSTDRHTTGRQGRGVPYNMKVLKGTHPMINTTLAAEKIEDYTVMLCDALYMNFKDYQIRAHQRSIENEINMDYHQSKVSIFNI